MEKTIIKMEYDRQTGTRIEQKDKTFFTEKDARKELDIMKCNPDILNVRIDRYTVCQNGELLFKGGIARYSVFSPETTLAGWISGHVCKIPIKAEVRILKKTKQKALIQVLVEGKDVTQLISRIIASPFKEDKNCLVIPEKAIADMDDPQYGGWIQQRLCKEMSIGGYNGLFDKAAFIDLGNGKAISSNADYEKTEKKEVRFFWSEDDLEEEIPKVQGIDPYDLPEFVGQILDSFEDFLTEKHAHITNPEKGELVRSGEWENEDEVMLYGSDYDRLSDEIEEIVHRWKLTIPEER